MGTLGALAVRFRMALVTVPFAIVMLVVGLQVRHFNAGRECLLLCRCRWWSSLSDTRRATDAFPAFGETLSLFTRHYLPAILGTLLALSYVQAILLSTHASSDEELAASEPGHHLHSHLTLPSPWLADLLLGTPGSFWAPLAPLLVFAMVGVVVIEYLVLSALVGGTASTLRWLQRNGNRSMQSFFR